MKIDEFAKKVFEKAAQYNFDAFELYYQYGSALSLQAFEGKINSYADSNTAGVNFRAVVGGKSGSCFSEVLDLAAIDYMVESAYQAALHIENDDDIYLVSPGLDYPKLDLFSEKLAALDSEPKIDLVIDAEARALNDDIIKHVNGVNYGDGMTGCRLFNSNGVDIAYQTNNAYAYISAIGSDQDATYSALAIAYGRDFDDLVKDDIVSKAHDKLAAKFGAKTVSTGQYQVAFSGEAFAKLLSVFIAGFSAEMVQKDMSLLKGKIGQTIAAEQFSLIDDPLLPNGLASAPFDGEGVPTYKKHLIKDGKLETFLHNMNTAKKDGVTTTGNASRGSFKSTIGVAPSNAFVAPGTVSPAELYQQLGSGLLITELDGLHAGANAISGDFSLSARGFKIEDGKKTTAVNQIVVSGNFFELIKNVAGIADDLEFVASPIGAPTIYVGQLNVAGA